MVNKCRFRIQKLLVPGGLGKRPSLTYMVLGRVNGKAVVENFKLKKQAQAFIKRRKKVY